MRRASTVLWREAAFGVVVLAPDSREPQTLAGTGRALWDVLAGPVTLAELTAVLAARFDADPARVEADIAPVLDELHRLGAIEWDAR